MEPPTLIDVDGYIDFSETILVYTSYEFGLVLLFLLTNTCSLCSGYFSSGKNSLADSVMFSAFLKHSARVPSGKPRDEGKPDGQ